MTFDALPNSILSFGTGTELYQLNVDLTYPARASEVGEYLVTGSYHVGGTVTSFTKKVIIAYTCSARYFLDYDNDLEYYAQLGSSWTY